MGVYDDKNTTCRIRPHGHKPLLASSFRILPCEGVGIEKHHLSIGEANPMLPVIRSCFLRISHNPHTAIIYIHYTYIKCLGAATDLARKLFTFERTSWISWLPPHSIASHGLSAVNGSSLPRRQPWSNRLSHRSGAQRLHKANATSARL